ncbi:MAG: porin family protein [Aequorivita sp.]
MGKLYIAITLIFLISTASTSQNVQYGVKAGMNISKLSGNSNDPFSRYDGKVGFHLGGIIELALNEKFSIQPELLYSYQGTDINYGERVVRLNNLQLPIIGKYYIVKGLSAEVGPVFSYLLSAKYVATLTSQGGRQTIDITDNYKSVDIALGLGASYRLKSDLFFGLRYNFGLLNINDADVNNAKVRSNVFQLSVGYFF